MFEVELRNCVLESADFVSYQGGIDVKECSRDKSPETPGWRLEEASDLVSDRQGGDEAWQTGIEYR
jgi:hypothetical protein